MKEGNAISDAVKCVVWDLDGTVWPGVAIELPAGQHPRPRPEILRAMAVLEERGIVNSLASRTDPAMARVVAGRPELAGRFVAPQVGWGHKSDAIARIADELGISTKSMAFVDDNPFERAEVAAVLPEVLVLTPDELLASLDSTALRPEVITEEARRRVGRYREEERRRRAERDFAGRREDFLHASEIRLHLRPARVPDVPRVAELLGRTHRFNTTGEPWSAQRVAAVLDDRGWRSTVASLDDRFGRYGLIGVALVEQPPDEPAGWRLRMLAVSCRAAGREVPIALLARVMGAARTAGAAELRVDLRDTGANLELRMLLRRSGFRAAGEGTPAASGTLTLARPLAGDLPAVPAWLHIHEEPDEEPDARG